MFELISIFVLVWLRSMMIGHCLQVRCFERERLALVKFREQGMDVDGRLSSWSRQEDCCKWEGVHCHNKTNHVTTLDLPGCSLGGGIPISMMNCTSLRMIDVGENRLIGEIPTWMRSKLSNLRVLSLHQNEFYDLMWKGNEVDYKNGLGLVKLLDFSSNNLIGEIPSEIMKLVDLVGLNLSRNKLSGSIPQDIGRMMTLNYLDFSRNHLSGGIPTSFSELSHLGVLDLSYNNLSGRFRRALNY